MTRIGDEIRIEGPVETVFARVTTTRYRPRWHPATEGVSPTDRWCWATRSTIGPASAVGSTR